MANFRWLRIILTSARAAGGGSISSQTILASQLHPPVAPDWTGNIFGLMAAGGGTFFVVLVMFSGFSIGLGFLGGALAAAIVCAFLYQYQSKQMAARQKAYQQLMIRWSRSWICLRCGANWMIS